MADFLGILTLRAYKVSFRRKVVFVSEVVLFCVLLYILLGTELFSGDLITRHILWAIIVYIGARIVLSTIQLPLVSAYRARRKLPREERDNFILGINALSLVLSIVAVVVGVFIIFRIEIRPIITSLGLFSVAIAWVGKEYINNFIDSFILMFSKDFQLGEYIRIDPTTKGVIQDITFRATKIRTDDGDTLFVPNSKLLHSDVVNFSKTHLKRISMPFSMYRNRLHDLAAFEERVKDDICAAFPNLLQKEQVYLRVMDIHNHTADLALEVSVTQYNFAIEEQIKKWFASHVLAGDEKVAA